MDTIRVDICYRPLRICWAIQEGDFSAFREAVRLSHTLWGGRYNPIVVVERAQEAEHLIDVFRADVVLPIGDAEIVKNFPTRFPHLIKPFFSDTLFLGGAHERKAAQVLDIQNALVHLRDTPAWKEIRERGFRVYNWQADDPLGDVFMVQFGMYPAVDEHGIDYMGMLINATEAKKDDIGLTSPIQADTLIHPTISYLSRLGLERRYSVRSGWERPGFFVGEATCLDDLVYHWNLRAADIPLWFVDPSHLQRYASLIPAWEKLLRERVVLYRQEVDRYVAAWSRHEKIYDNHEVFGHMPIMKCKLSLESWNGHNVSPPMMSLGEVSTLGVLGRVDDEPKISFQLDNKPFCGDVLFHSQHLVASISFIAGLYGNEQYTLMPPFIPELNEFYARTMYFSYKDLRIEPDRIGLVIAANETDTIIYGLSVSELVEKIFLMAGFSTELSSGGLITRQLIAQLGGLRNASVFKIPGVRRLLKTYGPAATFTRNAAIQLIGGRDPENAGANFKDYQDLYIEPRDPDTKLKPCDVFAYLVEKGLFRIGVQLDCPNCRMASWTPLDVLKQRVVCDLCGADYDATRQLVNSEWYYRRSGVLGKELNAQGAVPVALTLQQLKTNFSGVLRENLYSQSLNLGPLHDNLPECEVDFVWVITEQYPDKTIVILGECKNQGGVIDTKDIDNLRRVADAFPRKRFEVFILLAKLSPFTQDEVERAKTLNTQYSSRAILLTARELEPHGFFDRTANEVKMKPHASTAEDLALATIQMYFKSAEHDKH